MVSWCGHEELCINHSSLQLSVSSHTANAHWEWGDVSSSHTSRCRELSPPTAMGTLIICSCWIGKLHYSVPGIVLSTIMTAVWIVLPGRGKPAPVSTSVTTSWWRKQRWKWLSLATCCQDEGPVETEIIITKIFHFKRKVLCTGFLPDEIWTNCICIYIWILKL